MKNKNIFIVGGNSGIGLEMVNLLNNGQHNIHIGSRTEKSAANMSGVDHFSFDATNEPLQLEALPETLDGLAYCPGTIRLKPFQRLTANDFREDFKINVLGAVNVIQACLKRLKKASGGASIILFSTVAVGTGMPFHTSVASAKAAVEGLTRSLAAELAPRIRVNAIAPSITDTPLAQDLLSSEDRRKAAVDRHPLKRIGDPRDVAGLAVHLLSDASAHITGQVIPVDGGLGVIRTFR